MNRLEIRLQARNALLETTPGFWSDAELNQAINDGCDDLSAVALLPRYISWPSSGQGTLPEDFLLARDVYWLDADGHRTALLPREGQASPSSEQGVPVFYVLNEDAKTLSAWPIPAESGTLELYYAGLLPHLNTDTDVPALPDRWHRLLVYWTAAQGLLKSQDAAAGTYMAEYASGKEGLAMERMAQTQRMMTARSILAPVEEP